MSSLPDEGLNSMKNLEILDLRENKISEYPTYVIKNLASLRLLYASNYKLCCSQFLPEGFNTDNCFTKKNALDHCEDLLQSNAYRVMLWIFSVLSVFGNTGSITLRLLLTDKSQGSFGMFVTSLSLSDFAMGIYLIIIGVADVIYQNDYVIYTETWKTSYACHIAGFISLMSSEVSAFTICLITLDRFLVLRFPFSKYHFGQKSTLIACVTTWSIGAVIAAIPLLTPLSNWQFFSQSSVCVPLPFTDTFQGQILYSIYMSHESI